MDGPVTPSPDPRVEGELVELHRAHSGKEARELSLVLRARRIPFRTESFGAGVVLLVPAAFREEALRELALYVRENVDFPPREVLPAAAPGWVAGTAVYAALLVLVHTLESSGAFGLPWWAEGRAVGTLLRGGELERAFTALTLHTGVPHLLGNVVFGALFGALAGHAHGGGLAWLAILSAGGLGNLSNAWIRSGSEYSAVGASTAVFAAIGLIAASEWRRRHVLRVGRLRRLAPLLAGLVFLGYLGVGDVSGPSRTDVSAHVTGFFWGLVAGTILGSLPVGAHRPRGFQLACGTLALGALAFAWTRALLA